MNRILLSLGVVVMMFGCQEHDRVAEDSIPSDALFQLRAAEDTGIDFSNNVHDGQEFNVLTYRNFYNGGGVSIGDVNNDGLVDVFFTANMEPNKLYLNKGNLKFEEVGASAGISGRGGWSTGSSMADVNGDGLMDIYVCNSGDIAGDNKSNELFINNGDLTFTESAVDYGLDNRGFSTHASFFDYDQDGDLDCYVLNNSFKDPNKIDMNVKGRGDKDEEGGDKFYRNDGGRFTDVTEEAGIYSSKIGFGLGVSVSDVNGDNAPDIYISNDFYERDYLYLNNGDGTFTEDLTSRIDVCSISSMGADINDINNDGTADIFTTDMLAADNYRIKAFTLFDSYSLKNLKYRESFHYQILQNTLQLNDGTANFQEVANLSKVAATDWSWGALMFDFQNDGHKDIFVANGIYKDIMYLDFTNFIHDKDEVKRIVTEKGKFDWRDFAEYIPSNPLSNYAFVNRPTGPASIPQMNNEAQALGLGTKSFSNGSAYGDLDNDGDLDLIVNNVNMPAFVYENTSTNNYLKIKLEGAGKNPFGIGAKLEIVTDDGIQTQQVYTARGFESSVDPSIVFGIGKNPAVKSLKIIWPNGKVQEEVNIASNQTLVIKQSDADLDFVVEDKKGNGFFKDATSSVLGSPAIHKENRYNDFDHERLAFRMLSTEGPALIKGDLDGDGTEDVIVGGATGSADMLYFNKRGRLVAGGASWSNEVEQHKNFETTDGVIFDADGDGDNDVLLAAGGNEYQKGIENFLLRYYENNGDGTFSYEKAKTPPAAGNVSCIEAADIDGDGDIDVFVGSRVVPGNYGLPPRSFLLRNEGNGQWTDITTKEIGNAGMVSDAAWTDVDGDDDADLILLGDWMPIMVFENENGTLLPSQKQTNKPYAGWWNRIIAADLDQDGDDDYVVGNWGSNSKFSASDKERISMYVKDFDTNKKSEFIINWYAPNEDKAYPFASKMDMTGQLPALKKQNLTHEAYAKQNYETLLTEEQRQGAFDYHVNTLESAVIWNEANGLDLQPLPIEAQVTPIYAISADDFDGDGNVDLWLGGNYYELQPQAGRSDSGKGILLKGNGQKTFTFIPNDQSGLYLEGACRDAITLNVGGKSTMVVARNNDAVKAYQYK